MAVHGRDKLVDVLQLVLVLPLAVLYDPRIDERTSSSGGRYQKSSHEQCYSERKERGDRERDSEGESECLTLSD